MVIEAVLDTSIIVDYFRKIPAAKIWFLQTRLNTLAITPIVWMEVIEGARNNLERDQILRFLKQFPIEHPTIEDNRWAMRQFAHFHLGYGVELTDILIASVAVRLNVPLYTLNIKHYAVLPNLNTIRPY